MENKSTVTASQFGSDVVPAPDDPEALTYEPTALTRLKPTAIQTDMPTKFFDAQAFRRFVRRFVLVAAALLLLGTAGIFGVNALTGKKQAANNGAGQIGATEIPLGDLATSAGDLNLGTRSLAVNGSLKANDAFILTPQAQPAQATAGQMYFDSSSNQLAYYNGTKFVSLGTAQVLSLTSGTPTLTIVNDGSGNLTIRNTAVVTSNKGTVTSSGGTAGRIAKFTGVQNLEDSLLSDNGTLITVNGDLSVTGGISLSSPLSVANGGTGTATLTANGVLTGNGTGAITSVTAAGAGLCLLSNVGAPSFQACPGGVGAAFVQNGNSFGATAVLGTNDNFGLNLEVNNTVVATFSATGAAAFTNTSNSTQAFNVKNAGAGNLFTVDTTNSRVGINLGGNNAPNLANQGLEIQGALRLSGSTASFLDQYTTPLGSPISAKLSAVNYDVAAFGQQLAFGLTAASAASARSISLFDARAGVHQPTISVFSPDENYSVGFTWNGSNAQANVQTSDQTAGGNTRILVLQSGAVSGGAGNSGDARLNTGTVAGGSGQISGTIYVVSGDGLGTNSSTGDVRIDSGVKSGSGTAGVVYLANSNASGLVLGRAGLTTSNSGSLLLAQLGTTDTSAVICRNSANVLAACATTGSGVAFVQDGNSLGATAVLGTNDNFGLNFEVNNTVVASLTNTGAATLQNTSNSVSAFKVNTAGGATVLGVDTLNAAVTAGGVIKISDATDVATSLIQTKASDGSLRLSTAIIGNAANSFHSDANADKVDASKYNSGPGGTLDSLNVYFSTVDGGAPHFRVAIYSDNAGTPDALLSSPSSAQAVAVVDTWTNAPLGATVTLAPNTDYWLALTTESGGTVFTGQNGTSRYQNLTYGTNFSGTFTVDDTFTDAISIYGTYKTVNDASFASYGLRVGTNNQVEVRPTRDTSYAFYVSDTAGNSKFEVDTVSGFTGVAGSLQLNGIDTDYGIWARTSGAKGFGFFQETANAADNPLEVFSNVAGFADRIFRVQADGAVFADGAYTGTGADYAEYFGADPAHKPQAGDIVALNADDGLSVVRAGVATRPMGIVSTKPGFVGNGPQCNGKDDSCAVSYYAQHVAVALNGQVPTRVSVANGAIAVGDPIAVSARAGVGQKATTSGYVIGYAQEATGVDGTITVLVNPGYYDASGGLQAQNVSFDDINVGGDTHLNNLTVTGSAQLASLTVAHGVTVGGNLSVQGTTSVADIVVGGHVITSGAQPTVVALPAAGTNAHVSIAGTDTAGTITITVGASVTADTLARVTFAQAYGAQPKVVLSPVGKASAAAQPYVDQPTIAGFAVGINGTPQAGATYTFTYQTLQ